jgi:hypothetical protein
MGVSRGLVACVPRRRLRVLHGSVLLHVCSQRTPHHLKGDQLPWDSELICDRVIRHLKKFFACRGTFCPLREPRPNVGSIRASGEVSGQFRFPRLYAANTD